MGESAKSPGEIITLPKGGGAQRGLGEKFAPDLHTGTGNFSVPIALPPGRNGFQPQLTLGYSTGQGNGNFGLGWNLSVPGVSRRTSKGVPTYDDAADVFVLSGAEDLVPVTPVGETTLYRPRTEGLFAEISHVRSRSRGDNFWRVRSKDGLTSTYGTPGGAGNDAATLVKPEVAVPPGREAPSNRVFAWRLTRTVDAFGNAIVYEYDRDRNPAGAAKGQTHRWDQPILRSIRYVEYQDAGQTRYLVQVAFEYEDRPDPFSEYRAGFEIRATKRCSAIHITTHADQVRPVRSYRLTYESDRYTLVSRLTSVQVVGYDDEGKAHEELPPLDFGYSAFQPKTRKFVAVGGREVPPVSLARPDFELVDLNGNGLPDILELNGTARYWSNMGGARYDMARMMANRPAGLALADPGVQLLDADGDGRPELMVSGGSLSGYYALQHDGTWDVQGFRRYPRAKAPSFSLEDPEVRLLDLDGDGVTDAIRSGSRFECFFNSRDQGWYRSRPVARRGFDEFPDVSFADPRVKTADMTGDGLQDIVLVHDRDICYWPNLGGGDWGGRISMRGSPRLPYRYDPQRLLLGDVDGDGLADLVYVEDQKVQVWFNQGGNAWSAEPVCIMGTPRVADTDATRLVDLNGTGTSGILWTADARSAGRPNMFFLDLTGGVKPNLLHRVDNNMGAVTLVDYAPSTRYYLADAERPKTRWRTSLPFPVQVVARVEVIDAVSGGKLTTEYRYHHGYWDGAEREFRGFGMVEQLDTEVIGDYQAQGLHGEQPFAAVSDNHFSPPLLTKTWFHQGPIGPEAGDWSELDLTGEYWSGDAPMLGHTEGVNATLRSLRSAPHLRGNSRRAQRDALRALRGTVLRTELYALDDAEGTWQVDGQDKRTALRDRPYTVTEAAYDVRLVYVPPPETGDSPSSDHSGCVFYPHAIAQRTTQWERGDDPMTQLSFTDYRDADGQFDAFGRPRRQTAVACPRGWRTTTDRTADLLATRTVTEYAEPGDVPDGVEPVYIHDRVARVTSYEIVSKRDAGPAADVVRRTVDEVRAMADGDAAMTVFTDTIHRYDGDEAFAGLEPGIIGAYGAVTRSLSLVLTDAILQAAYADEGMPPYLRQTPDAGWKDDYPPEFAEIAPLAGYVPHEETGHPAATAGYYVPGAQVAYDFQTGGGTLGLPVKQRDPLGHETTIVFDRFGLLPVQVRDAREMETTAQYNLRVLQPELVTDANGNRIAFAFSPSGLPASSSVMGKVGEEVGDEVGDVQFPGVVFSYGLRAYYDSIRAGEPAQPVFVHTVKRTEHAWDLVRAENERRTADGKAAMTAAEIGAYLGGLSPLTEPDLYVQVREYSDGFGRLAQTRVQAEEETFGDAVLGGFEAEKLSGNGVSLAESRVNTDPAQPNVVVSGWQVYDNKGRVVEKYEPFYAVGWAYDGAEAQRGEHATLEYAPRGQVIKTLNPDGSLQSVIHGVPVDLSDPSLFRPTPWEAYTYDPNDNAGRSTDKAGQPHRPQAEGYRHHWDTPANIVIDGLGRTVLSVARDRPLPDCLDTRPNLDTLGTDLYRTRSRYDIRGNLLELVDPLGRVAFRYIYDLANRALRVDSIDAGRQVTVLDAAGNVVEQWDRKGTMARDQNGEPALDASGKPLPPRPGKGSLSLHRYDELNRPTHLWARNDATAGDGQPRQGVTLRQRLEYGDDPTGTAEREAAKTVNAMGKLTRHFDEAGVVTLGGYDFKGNLLRKTRQVIADSELQAHCDQHTGNLRPPPFVVDWSPGMAGHPVSNPGHETLTAYDALNRATWVQYPADSDKGLLTAWSTFNRSGAVVRVTAKRQRGGETEERVVIERVAYDAKGQRVLLAYGNGVLTRYAYDRQTYRLVRLRTEPCWLRALGDGVKYDPRGEADGSVLLDLTYGYDLVGNITSIFDQTPGCGVSTGRGADVDPRNSLKREFRYDPLYRLVTATGRETAALGAHRPWQEHLQPKDGYYGPGGQTTPNRANAPDLTRLYREGYEYDAAGNLLAMRHMAEVEGGPRWSRRFGMGVPASEWSDVWRKMLGGTKSDQPLTPQDIDPGAGNRLTHFEDSGTPTCSAATHLYDEAGNMEREFTNRQFQWDYANRLIGFRDQPNESTKTSIQALYLYDAAGLRVKKWVRKSAAAGVAGESRTYIDEMIEYGVWQGAASTVYRFMDANQHVLRWYVGDLDWDTKERLKDDEENLRIQYFASDHLGSATVSTTDQGMWVNREEFFPYGETSHGGYVRKRYRFTAKERDEESGKCYHGARYLSTSDGIWISCDREWTSSSTSLYQYAGANPVTFADYDGCRLSPDQVRLLNKPRDPRWVAYSETMDRARNAAASGEHEKAAVLKENAEQLRQHIKTENDKQNLPYFVAISVPIAAVAAPVVPALYAESATLTLATYVRASLLLERTGGRAWAMLLGLLKGPKDGSQSAPPPAAATGNQLPGSQIIRIGDLADAMSKSKDIVVLGPYTRDVVFKVGEQTFRMPSHQLIEKIADEIGGRTLQGLPPDKITAMLREIAKADRVIFLTTRNLDAHFITSVEMWFIQSSQTLREKTLFLVGVLE